MIQKNAIVPSEAQRLENANLYPVFFEPRLAFKWAVESTVHAWIRDVSQREDPWNNKVIPVPYLHAVCLRPHCFKNVKSLIYFHLFFIVLSSSNTKEISDFVYLRKVCAVELFDFSSYSVVGLFTLLCVMLPSQIHIWKREFEILWFSNFKEIAKRNLRPHKKKW